MPQETIPFRLERQASQTPDKDAYFVKDGSGWTATNWKTYLKEVRTAARALLKLGLKEGDTVTILGFNRPEWVVMDLAAMMIGAIPAGIYTTCSADEVQYIVNHSECPVILIEDMGQWEKINQKREDLPKLKHVVMMTGGGDPKDDLAMGWDEFMAMGADESAPEEATRKERLEALKPDQTATLIYTSGTTGPPKGVMLSHENLAWTASGARDRVGLGQEDCTLSYLPLSHIAEQMFTIHAPISVGSSVYFAESMEKLPDNLKEVQPTIFFGVPRVWEKFHAGLKAKLSEATGFKAMLVKWALGIGNQVSALRCEGKEPTGFLAWQYNLANKLIFSKVKPAVGMGRAKICVSGAAPIAPEVLQFFTGLDLIVHEIYGQSEGSGPTTFNLPGNTRFGTVGTAFADEVEVKIAEDGEIIAKGPNIFKGYFKNPEATSSTLIDGWLYSGDLGSFDADGFLTITGRKKDLIITAGGKNIAPKNIEAALGNIELVEHAVLIGDRRRFISALLTLDMEAAQRFADANGIEAGADLRTHPKVQEHLEKEIEESVNSLFARVEHVRKFKVLPRSLGVETGELTPTLKIKRRIINDNFADEIEAMYA